ncbi:AEC family transporter [Pseudonocardia sp. TRM90224]|uniref:AEC family transporter n=1 Tax=Pseudonocardia sp. TRM90224 TaxID=2812678 RepID=UPI001E455D89|nr:AEC family transporter [Pseudonocardia sp. TRM90224]
MAPLFAVVLIGYAASFRRTFDSGMAKTLNDFVYYVPLPALLFTSVARADLTAGIPMNFGLAIVAGIVVAWLLGAAGARLLFRRSVSVAGAVGMVAAYGNVAYLGVPLLIAIRGADAAFPAALGSLVHNLLCIGTFLAWATITEQRDTGPGAARSTTTTGSLTRTIARRVLLNPVALSVAAGLVVAGLRLQVPGPVWQTGILLGAAAAPGALFALGLTLRRAVDSLRAGALAVSEIGFAVQVKLILQPAVVLLLVTFAFPMPPLWALVTVLMAALPNAATCYVLAQQFDVHVQEVAATVVLSTLLAIFSLSAIAALLLA